MSKITQRVPHYATVSTLERAEQARSSDAYLFIFYIHIIMNYNVAQVVPGFGKYKGQTRYYAKPVPTRKINFEEVVSDISEMSSLTTGDVRNAIDRIAYYLRRELAAGNTVQLGQIGTFSIVATSKQVGTKEEVNASIINRPRVQLHMTATLRSAARSLQLSVNNPFAKPAATAPKADTVGGGDPQPREGGEGSGDDRPRTGI